MMGAEMGGVVEGGGYGLWVRIIGVGIEDGKEMGWGTK